MSRTEWQHNNEELWKVFSQPADKIIKSYLVSTLKRKTNWTEYKKSIKHFPISWARIGASFETLPQRALFDTQWQADGRGVKSSFVSDETAEQGGVLLNPHDGAIYSALVTITLLLCFPFNGRSTIWCLMPIMVTSLCLLHLSQTPWCSWKRFLSHIQPKSI